MKFESSLHKGKLIKRYKRFLADVELENGDIVTAHTANTGSMKGLTEPGNAVYLQYHDNPKRKLKFSWEMVQVGRTWVGINTGLPNKLVKEAIENGTITELQGYSTIKPEVKYGENSRIDLLLSRENEKCYVEVKNVTLVENGQAYFPDSPSVRAQKHLKELETMVKQGHRGVMVFVLQRKDAHTVHPAHEIDPLYGKLIKQVTQNGVEALAYQAQVSKTGIKIHQKLNFSTH